MKRGLASMSAREVHIKPPMRDQLTLIRLAIILVDLKKQTGVGDVVELEFLCTLGRNANVIAAVENSVNATYKLIPLLDLYPKKKKN